MTRPSPEADTARTSRRGPARPARPARPTRPARAARPRARDLVEPRHWVSGATESIAGLGQFVLMLRLGATLMLVVAAVLIDPEPARLLVGTLIAAAVTAAELDLLVRRPSAIVHWPGFVLAELVAGAGIVVLMQGGPVFFSFSCGSAAVFGVAAGLRAWPVWVLQTVAAYAVVAWIIRTGSDGEPVPATLAVYLTGVPTLYILVGLAAATARAAVIRHVNLARSALDAIERSAVAAERTRVARELHDSVEKTLRGLSFAAASLPEAVQQRPELVADLARTVATGAATAADEARELLGMLRADDLEAGLAEAIERAVQEWSAKTGLPVSTDLEEATRIEVELPVRHEVLRIVREALGNVAKHSGAAQVWIDLSVEKNTLRLMIKDDGRGFGVPADLTRLSAAGHYGVVGMAERAQQIGGRLKVWSGPDLGAVGGTQVVLWAPAEPVSRPIGRTR